MSAMRTSHRALLLAVIVMAIAVLPTGICTSPAPAPAPTHMCSTHLSNAGCDVDDGKTCQDKCSSLYDGHGLCDLREGCSCRHTCKGPAPPRTCTDYLYNTGCNDNKPCNDKCTKLYSTGHGFCIRGEACWCRHACKPSAPELASPPLHI